MAEFPKHPFLLTFEETAQALGTDIDKGLTSAQVADLQAKFPPNELDVGGTVPWYKIFAKQLFNAMIIVSGCLHLELALVLFSLSRWCSEVRHSEMQTANHHHPGWLIRLQGRLATREWTRLLTIDY